MTGRIKQYREDRAAALLAGRQEQEERRAGKKAWCYACLSSMMVYSDRGMGTLWRLADGTTAQRDLSETLTRVVCQVCKADQRLQSEGPARPFHPAIVRRINRALSDPELDLPEWALNPNAPITCGFGDPPCTEDVEGYRKKLLANGGIIWTGQNLEGKSGIRHRHLGPGVAAEMARKRWA